MSRGEPEVEYVTWPQAPAGYSIRYVLPVFQQIDALVIDGYRRIPYGGIETGGVLFGVVEDSIVRIDAFRQIECEHAYGPSFQLSERDLAGLSKQLADAALDTSLDNLTPIGWFVAHTRSELVLSDREIEFFKQLFPGAGRVSVIAKPDKFKATRFAFLVRDREGRVPADGRTISSVLPQQPERAAEANRPRPTTEEKSSLAEPLAKPVEIPPLTKPVDTPPPPKPPTPIRRQALPDDTAPTEKKIEPTPIHEVGATPKTDRDVTAPSLAAAGVAVKERSEGKESKPVPSLRLLNGSLIAATLIFATLAGYGFWLRFTSAVVPITITPSGDKLIVSWPAGETQNAQDAELRVNNGPAQHLSDTQKASGTFSLPNGGGDVMVDLVIHRQFRTSRGITRYLVTPAGS